MTATQGKQIAGPTSALSDSDAAAHGDPQSIVDVLRRRSRSAPHVGYRFLRAGQDPSFLSFAALDEQARAVAASLQSLGLGGRTALLLFPAGLEFLPAFFGCLYAGVLAIPAPLPTLPRLSRLLPRIQGIIKDAQPQVVLTDRASVGILDALAQQAPEFPGMRRLIVEDQVAAAAAAWRDPGLTPSSVAYLQYTSGSTSLPRGTQIDHGNLLANSQFIQAAWGYTGDSVSVVWVPAYHDDGLVQGLLQPLFTGYSCVLLPSQDFIARPDRWLQAISDYRATHSGGPNFAYELAQRRISDAALSGIDLSSWSYAYNAAEPVRWQTLTGFYERFRGCGFRFTSLAPCFGLAEATLLVTATRCGQGPRRLALDGALLEQRSKVKEADPASAQARLLVSCGAPVGSTRLVVVRPGTNEPCPEDEVGEILVHSPSVARGYQGRPAETAETFGARLHDGAGPFLRTGDLGFVRDGELFIAGRHKDLIVIRGENRYPQDIEWTVQSCDPAIRPGGVAAFSLEHDGIERLAIVAEARLGEPPTGGGPGEELFGAIRQAVAEQHDLQVDAIALLEPGSIPKTSSGKIQRSECRRGFCEGTLQALARWQRAIPAAAAPAATAGPQAPPESGAPPSDRAREIESWLRQYLGQQLGIAASELQAEQPFARYGLDSTSAVAAATALGDWLGRPLAPTLLWQHVTLGALSRHLASAEPGPAAEALRPGAPAPGAAVAIIGMACRFPGEVTSPHELWQLLIEGRSAISDLPAARRAGFPAADDVDGVPDYARRGGFLAGLDGFDTGFFGISPREAASLDPQQRLLLEVGWEALQDARLVPERLRGTATGVFVGLCGSDYQSLLLQDADASRVDAYTFTGTMPSVASGRLSYLWGLTGPSLTVDTACSSSLVAVHLACQSLRAGESSLALAGGVNVILSPAATVSLGKLRALSPSGRCSVFDAAADGYVRSEGCAVVVLKRLADAERDGDRILAVIRGSAINQDGRSNGLTAPSGAAQEAVVARALADAGVAAHQVAYLEAHGTGTPLGDPIELMAAGRVLGQDRSSAAPLYVGSIKSNLGHTEAAAGVAGLLKAVLALQHAEIPPNLHFVTPSPHIPWDQLPLRVPTARTPWPVPQRLAGVSSFGMSGTNAHLVLAAAPPPQPERQAATAGERPLHLFIASAASPEALTALAARYAAHAGSLADQQLGDFCFSAATTRSHLPERLAAVVGSRAELVATLQQAGAVPLPANLQRGRTAGERPRLVMLFGGQGGQYVGMGRALYDRHPVFRAALEQCAAILDKQLPRPLLEILYAQPAAPGTGPGPLDEAEYTQPAIFALQWALYQLWRSFGIVPDALLGHSIGEYAAACAAGVFALEDALRLIAARGRLMQALPERGAMVAVEAPLAAVDALLRGREEHIALAADNAPDQLVLSGNAAALAACVAELTRRGVRTRQLAVSHAFHSPLMRSLRAAFAEIARTISYHPPRLPLSSTVDGSWATADLATADYWVRHLEAPVRFREAIGALADWGAGCFIALDSQTTLLALGQRCVAQPAQWLPSLRRDHDPWTTVLSSLGQLYLRGVAVDWARYDLPYGRRTIALPTYPFQRQRHWVAPRPRAAGTRSAADRYRHPLLGEQTAVAGGERVYEAELSLAALPYLADHQIYGHITVPAAAFLDLGQAAALSCFGPGVHQVAELSIERPLVLTADGVCRLQTVLRSEQADLYELSVYVLASAAEGPLPPRRHATARLRRGSDRLSTPPCDLAALRQRCQEPVTLSAFRAANLAVGIEHGPSFHGLAQAWAGPHELLGHVALPKELATDGERYGTHPALLDAALQAIGCLNQTLAAGVTFLPFLIEQFCVLRPAGSEVFVHVRARQEEAGAAAELLAADATLYAPTGEAVAVASGVKLRRAERQRFAEDGQLSQRQAALYVRQWEPAPLAGPAGPPRRWILVGDDGEPRQALAARLAAAGLLARCATPTGPGFLATDALAAEPGLGICVLAAQEPTLTTGPGPAEIHARLRRTLELVQELVQAARHRPRPVVWVTRGCQHTGKESGPLSVAGAAEYGLMRVAQAEHPELGLCLVDLETGAGEQQMGRAAGRHQDDALGPIVSELGASATPGETVWRHGQRWRPVLVVQGATLSEGHPPVLDPHAAYLVTGGLGALGLHTAQHLAARGARHLVLVGRSAPSRAAQAQLAALTAAGCAVRVVQADVADRAALAQLLAEVVAERTLRGIVHAAGVLADALLTAQTPERLDAVLAPKVDGALHLDALSRGLPLDFFVLYSSAAPLFGAAGQAAYAAANACLDALAAARRQQGLVAQSIAWGPWAGATMAGRGNAIARLAARGFLALTPAEGLALLDQALAGQAAYVAALKLATGSRAGAISLGLGDRSVTPRPTAAAPAGDHGQILPRLAQLPPEQRPAALQQFVQEVAIQVLGLSARAELAPSQALRELGLDSLMALELRNRLATALAVSLPASFVFDYPTISAQSQQLVQLVRLEPLTAPVPPGPAVGMTDAAKPRSTAAPGSLLVTLRSGGSRPPLFLVPGVDGLASTFLPLAGALDPEQPLYSFQAPGLLPGERPLSSVEALAGAYLAALAGIAPHGPYFLGGYSFGCQVVFEMARQLEAAGQRVARLVLLDPVMPPYRAANDPPLLRVPTLPEWVVLLSRLLGAPLSPDAVAGLAAPAQLTTLAHHLIGDAPSEHAEMRDSLERRIRMMSLHLLASNAYPATAALLGGRVAAPLLLLRAAQPLATPFANPAAWAAVDLPLGPPLGADLDWGKATDGGCAVRTVAGDHLSMLHKAQAPALAAIFAEALAETLAETPRPMAAPADHQAADSSALYPLSRGQERFWFLEQRERGAPVYHLYFGLLLTGPLAPSALQGALRALITRHPMLRTVFLELDGELRQRVLPAGEPELPVYEVGPDRGQASPRALLAGFVRESRDQPFELTTGPLLRARLLRLSAEQHLLAVGLHHIVADAWSIGVMARDLAQLYGAAVGEPAALPPLAYGYHDVVREEREWLESAAASQARAFWKARLQGLPALQLPTDRPPAATRTTRGDAVPIHLPLPLVEALDRLAAAQGCTLYVGLLAAWAAVLYRHAGQTDFGIGTVVANRPRQEHADLVGYCVNTAILRCDLGGKPSFRTLLGRLRQTTEEALAHAQLPYDELVGLAGATRAGSLDPLIQAAFIYENLPQRPRHTRNLHWTPILLTPDGSVPATAKFDLALTLAKTADGLSGQLAFSTDLFAASRPERLVTHLRTLLEGACADPDASIAELPLLTAAERAELLAAGGSAAVYPQTTLTARFAAQVARTPDRIAVVYEAESLTYAALAARASRVARRLQQLGVGPQTLVGVCLERSLDLVVALLGVLKAGGAYVPLDPSYPEQRLHAMMADSGVAWVLSHSTQQRSMPPGVRRLDLDCSSDIPESPADSQDVVSGVSAADPAYVIYTSGSTGQPKGVKISHGNVTRLFAATDAWFGFGADDVWTLFHSYAFDFSVWELWGALLYGGRLIVVPHLTSRSPEAFYALLCQHGVTVLNQTPSAFRQLMEIDLGAAPGAPSARALRYIIFGGEALDLPSLRPWFARHGDQAPRLVNMYGITETTVHVTYRPLTAADAEQPASVIGRPIPDLQLYVLDQNQQLVPIGVPGELYVGGAGVGSGYLNRPELDRERFLPRAAIPALATAGTGDSADRLYRTGDLVQRLASGDLEYLGRIDSQVKIRGFRIELGEIEAVLATHPAVRHAAVIVQQDGDGHRALSAFYVPAERAVAVAALRAHLAARLPDYMVPATYAALESLPLNENGKLDRRELARRSAGSLRAAAPQHFVSPQTPQEALLAEVWQDVLRCGPVGTHDSFFNLGGDSILSIRMLARARQAGFDFTLQQLFQHPTIHALLRATTTVSQQLPRSAAFSLLLPADSARITAASSGEVEDAYPLAALQLGMFVQSSLDASSDVYHDIFSYRLRTPLDESALRQALQEIGARHPMLRTAFALTGYSEPLQLVYRRAAIPLQIDDITDLDPKAQDAAIARWFTMERRRGFALATAPLLRVQLHRRGAADFNLSVSFHHAIFDGWSNALLLTELLQVYGALRTGAPLPPARMPSHSYRDFVAAERAAIADDAARAYWQRQLVDHETLRLPRPGAEPTSGEDDGLLTSVIPEAVHAGLQQLARTANVPLRSALLAAHLRLLAALANHPEGQTGLVTNGRLEEEGGEAVVGLFLNTVPFRLRIGEVSWLELARQAFQGECELLPYRRFPLSEIQKLAGGEQVFETGFNFVHFHVLGDTAAIADLEITGVQVFERHNYTLAVIFSLDALTGVLTLNMVFDATVLPRGQAERLAQSYQRTLAQMAAHPTASCLPLPLLSDAERERIVVDFNRAPPLGGTVEVRDALVPELFAAQAACTPDAPAVVCHFGLGAGAPPPVALSYQELEVRANRLAHYLRALGVAREVGVAVYLPRCAELVVSFLAILKAGGAYIPLDPGYPAERIAYMLADAQPAVLLTRQGLLAGLPPTAARPVALDAAAEELAAQPSSPPAVAVAAADLAYVIYTSGTTGRPHGVLVPHRGLPNLAASQIRAFAVEPHSRVLQQASASFDASVSEFLMALCRGAALHLFVREVPLSPDELCELLRRQAITHVTLPPSLLALLPATELPDLASLIVAGEPCPPVLAGRFGRGRRFLNAYGPTEATVCASIAELSPEDAAAPLLHAGAPMPGVQLYILDSLGAVAPIGTPGELFIGGCGLARGYLNQPERTGEKFVSNPFGPGRLYRTGDRARWRPDGRIELLGRIDSQVKLRGFRIELEEIRAALNAHPAVADSAAVVRTSEGGPAQLVAYVTRRAAPPTPELWPSTFEFPILDEALYNGMTNDTARMRSYQAAIARCVRDRVVVDVGTGPQAVLAVLCVRAGARRVYAIERDERVYRAALAYVQGLGLQDRIELFCGDARSVQLPELAEVCVSAIVGAIGGSEGSAVILNEARRLLRPGGVMLPARTLTSIAAVALPDEIQAAPQFGELARHYAQQIFKHVGQPFDLRLCISKFPRERVLSSAEVFEDLDFTALVPLHDEHDVVLRVEKSGRVDGLLAWVRVDFTAGVTLDLWERGETHLAVFFPLFDPGIEVAAGDALHVHCSRTLSQDGLHPDFVLRGKLVHRDGREVAFAHDSYQLRPRYKATSFYQRLFENEERRAAAPDPVQPAPLTAGALAAELRAWLRQRLPEYMIPAAFVELPRLPTTPSGKLDRRALPDPRAESGALKVLAPRSTLEHEIAEIWKEVLQIPQVGVNDNFFDLGGHSLLLMIVLTRLQERRSDAIELTELFDHPTVSSLAAHLQQRAAPDAAAGRGAASAPAQPTKDDVRSQRLAAREQRRQSRNSQRT